jgi:L-amino acid N-acyltransferase YncA
VSIAIRMAERIDLPAIVAIYNASIPGHTATADLTPVTVAEREAWFAAHEPDRHPLWVAVDGDKVIAWISLSSFYARAAWDPTVEASFYVHPERQRQGVGRSLLNHALARAPALGISTILAVVFGHNEASIALLESAGFERWGHLPGVTHMPEGRRDVVILGWECD